MSKFNKEKQVVIKYEPSFEEIKRVLFEVNDDMSNESMEKWLTEKGAIRIKPIQESGKTVMHTFVVPGMDGHFAYTDLTTLWDAARRYKTSKEVMTPELEVLRKDIYNKVRLLLGKSIVKSIHS